MGTCGHMKLVWLIADGIYRVGMCVAHIVDGTQVVPANTHGVRLPGDWILVHRFGDPDSWFTDSALQSLSYPLRS